MMPPNDQAQPRTSRVAGWAVGWSDWLGHMMEPRHGHWLFLCESFSMKLDALDLVKCFGSEIAFAASWARHQWNPFNHQ